MGHAHCKPAFDGHEATGQKVLVFSGLATLMRIVLMYYVDFYSLFEHPESDWEAMFEPKEAPQEPNLFGWGAY
ncbi:hypothetical protein [Porphyromonas gulae]|uniref:hypothetical protein n=1 Tax=Porphyromonas gulae TaxID=111105 RepID=UPI00126A2535|nr:hypothetical protein [Porphyromonas gulae]